VFFRNGKDKVKKKGCSSLNSLSKIKIYEKHYLITILSMYNLLFND